MNKTLSKALALALISGLATGSVALASSHKGGKKADHGKGKDSCKGHNGCKGEHKDGEHKDGEKHEEKH